MSSVTSDDDEEYAFVGSEHITSKRYPVHDCCEFEDIEALRRLICVPKKQSNEDNELADRSGRNDDELSSSSDDNDSTEAAHAAAIGHSPQPIQLKKAPDGQETKDDSATESMDITPIKNDEVCVPQPPGNAAAGEKVDTPPSGDTTEVAKSSGDSMESKEAEESMATVGEDATAIDHVAENKTETSGDADRQKNHSNGEIHKRASEKSPVKAGKKREIKYYCPHNLNERDSDENTPLQIAIHARKLEHVKLLLELGASVHKKSDGSPPVHTAISVGSVAQNAQFAYDCVVLLNEFGADLSAKDDAMHTPLYLACMFNLPQIVSFILADEAGLSTLNARSDRSGGRALHAAAKFLAVVANRAGRAAGGSSSSRARMPTVHHHPDGTVANSVRHIPGFPGKLESCAQAQSRAAAVAASSVGPSEEQVAQLLLKTEGIEIDATNTAGQTPLHVACLRGNWPVARLLLSAGASPELPDRRGFTPGQQAHKRGMPIPNELLEVLGGPPSSGTVAPPRDLIVDPDSATMIISHELCTLHRSCPPIRRDSQLEPPPENVRRLHVLIDEQTGILRSGEFGQCVWVSEGRRAAMTDILKVHEYTYVESISQLCSSIPDHPSAISNLDSDTTVSRWSFEAAMRAAGSICEAVDKVVAGDVRNAFCAIRPPGHHAGPRGIVRCANDPPDGGSHGFCLLNNVAIGAAYARSMYRNDGIRKVAIVDFDVHHGNGTEEIVRQLVPNVEKAAVRTPFALGDLASSRYRPWLDETDINNVFFSSTHGFGARGVEFIDVPQSGYFYPGSGKTHTSDAILNPSAVEAPSISDFILSQTWTRMGDDSRTNCCKIVNCGLALPSKDAIPGAQRLELRDTYRKKILPYLREFDPDIIFVSAGFDGHKKDSMNFGYVGMVEDDYEWITEQLVKIANTCCNGRVITVMEGGYKIHGGIVSPFARSVASHVRALVDGSRSRELYDLQDGEWESQFERHLIEERERKRQQKLEKLRQIAQQSQQILFSPQNQDAMHQSGIPEDPDAPSRKRRRNQVDYKELYEQMKREGFAS